MVSLITSFSLIVVGIALKEWNPKIFSFTLLTNSIRKWMHVLTKPNYKEPSVSRMHHYWDKINEFWETWSSTILAVVWYIIMVLPLLPFAYLFLEGIDEDMTIADESSKDVGGSKITSKIYDRMNSNERSFVECLVTPEDINASFKTIGGLEDEIKKIKKSLLPITKNDVAKSFKSSLMQSPGGILLHGPPGCGKTLLAKALARESGLSFVNVKSSDIKCSLYGKTDQKISSLFSFARKVQPVILFIDEIDSLLRSRSSEGSNELSVTRGIKNLFMQHMDGILNNSNKQIIIIGATNRKEDIDPAILRRMQPQIYIGLPNAEQRQEIFQSILENEQVDPDIDITKFAKETEGFSGSEIRDICKTAALNVLEELVNESKSPKNQIEQSFGFQPYTTNVQKDSDEFADEREEHVYPRDCATTRIRMFKTEDIMKVIEEWKNKEKDESKVFEMYT